jgi:hypothetical protein
MMTVSAELNSDGVPLRLENRQRIVHVVEYSHYPRRLAAESRRVAYTQDRSESGLGLDLPERVRPGELLRVALRNIDGQVDIDGLARVVWCMDTDSGRARAGVAILREDGERKMMRVRGRGVISNNPPSQSQL